MELYAIAIGWAILSAPFFHEGSHWFVTWLWHGKPKFQYGLLNIPNGVVQREIEDLDSRAIRFSGFAPFLWIPVAIIAFGYFFIEPSPQNLFMAVSPSAVILMSTESDAIALREPELYREMVLNDGFSRNPLFLPNWLSPEWLPRF